MDRAHPEESPGVGITRMSLAGTCSGHVIERGPKRGTKPRFCSYTCGAFVEGQGTLKPAAARLPPAMEWVCVNWRSLDGGSTHSPGASVTPDATFFRALASTPSLTPDQVQACDEMAGLCAHGRTVRRDTDAGQSVERGGEVVDSTRAGEGV